MRNKEVSRGEPQPWKHDRRSSLSLDVQQHLTQVESLGCDSTTRLSIKDRTLPSQVGRWGAAFIPPSTRMPQPHNRLLPSLSTLNGRC
ncbi:Hypothetical protein NTJ_04960 [Nesidiocoris tenuis]|uniref:Uncharacterized protein n=1 Tax=Nesidiocoris tenuis TaxID=355587 RepID=A0ABN7AP29_9HEMI|nr:Hypothetical protein NTJ_04960 [Nesidiocoris tenuis]